MAAAVETGHALARALELPLRSVHDVCAVGDVDFLNAFMADETDTAARLTAAQRAEEEDPEQFLLVSVGAKRPTTPGAAAGASSGPVTATARATAGGIIGARATSTAAASAATAHRHDKRGTSPERPAAASMLRHATSPVRRGAELAGAAQKDAHNRELQRSTRGALGVTVLTTTVASGEEVAPEAALVPRPLQGRSSQGATEYARANATGLAASALAPLLSATEEATGFLPLHAACAAGQAAIAARLLAMGADIEAETVPVPRRVPTAKETADALVVARERAARLERQRVAAAKEAERAKRRARRGKVAADEEDGEEEAAVSAPAPSETAAAARRRLQQEEVDAQAPNHSAYRALHLAVLNDHDALARALVESFGADPAAVAVSSADAARAAACALWYEDPTAQAPAVGSPPSDRYVSPFALDFFALSARNPLWPSSRNDYALRLPPVETGAVRLEIAAGLAHEAGRADLALYLYNATAARLATRLAPFPGTAAALQDEIAKGASDAAESLGRMQQAAVAACKAGDMAAVALYFALDPDGGRLRFAGDSEAVAAAEFIFDSVAAAPVHQAALQRAATGAHAAEVLVALVAVGDPATAASRQFILQALLTRASERRWQLPLNRLLVPAPPPMPLLRQAVADAGAGSDGTGGPDEGPAIVAPFDDAPANATLLHGAPTPSGAEPGAHGVVEPLAAAVAAGNVGAVKALVAAGADPRYQLIAPPAGLPFSVAAAAATEAEAAGEDAEAASAAAAAADNARRAKRLSAQAAGHAWLQAALAEVEARYDFAEAMAERDAVPLEQRGAFTEHATALRQTWCAAVAAARAVSL